MDEDIEEIEEEEREGEEDFFPGGGKSFIGEVSGMNLGDNEEHGEDEKGEENRVFFSEEGEDKGEDGDEIKIGVVLGFDDKEGKEEGSGKDKEGAEQVGAAGYPGSGFDVAGVDGEEEGRDKAIFDTGGKSVEEKEDEDGIEGVDKDIGEVVAGGSEMVEGVIEIEREEGEGSPVMEVGVVGEGEEGGVEGGDKGGEGFDPGVFDDEPEVVFEEVVVKGG